MPNASASKPWAVVGAGKKSIPLWTDGGLFPDMHWVPGSGSVRLGQFEPGQSRLAQVPTSFTKELPTFGLPAFESPALESPASDPPALEPPALEPPALEPPAVAEPPALEPPAVAEPPALEPPAVAEPPTEPPGVDELPSEPQPVANANAPKTGSRVTSRSFWSNFMAV